MSVQLRTLPVRVEPVECETLDGFISRLAHAHLLEEADIRRIILEQLGRKWWPAADPRIIDITEQLADLPAGALLPAFDEHGMRVRCGHHSWYPEKCQRCRRFADARTACLVCAGGVETTTVARGGALCLTHRHWAFRGLHADVSPLPEYEQAERVLRSQLWNRGVALHTGEINLAAAFVQAWHAGTDAPSVISERMKRFRVSALDTYDEVLLCAYPEVIRVASVMTAPRMITPVLNVTISALTQADLLMEAITKAIGVKPNNALRDFTISVVGHAHRAMLYMYSLRNSAQVKHQLCPLNRALMVAAHRQPACVLRHANPRGLPDIAGRPGHAAPRTRIIRNWPILIDELALP
ncbi:hypothetical protein [Microbacterium aurum]